MRDENDPTVIYETFKDAADARGLLEDENQWEKYFIEMSLFKMPVQLRQLFVTILYFCEPKCSAQLWEKFKMDMSEDFLHRYVFIYVYNCFIDFRLFLWGVKIWLRKP